MKIKIQFLKNRFINRLQINLRERRNLIFLSLIKTINKPISILDLGGTIRFWEKTNLCNNGDIQIIILNLNKFESSYFNIKSITGDARYLDMFKENEFDIVFSNSVIEHVGSYSDQFKMANEIKRIGKRYFIQTPYYLFPIEPHFRMIYFQLFPLWIKVLLLRYFRLGWYSRCSDLYEAIESANSVRLLKLSELRSLFPGAHFYREHFIGLTKSIIAYKGFDN